MNPMGAIVASPILNCKGAEGSAACGAGAGEEGGVAFAGALGNELSLPLLACCVCPNVAKLLMKMIAVRTNAANKLPANRWCIQFFPFFSIGLQKYESRKRDWLLAAIL
jgi:hypothetical protein